MGIPSSDRPRKYDERPESCRHCGSAAWWNGLRLIFQMVLDVVTGTVRRQAGCRRRARCSVRDCPGGSWTVYEETEYPHRSFQLPVIAAAVAELAARPNATQVSVAARYGCDRRSIARFVSWTADLVDSGELARTLARIEPDGLPSPRVRRVPGASGRGLTKRAASVLVLFEHLAAVLRHRGVDLGSTRPGLMAILGRQMRRFGDVFLLTRASPPLPIDLEDVPA